MILFKEFLTHHLMQNMMPDDSSNSCIPSSYSHKCHLTKRLSINSARQYRQQFCPESELTAESKLLRNPEMATEDQLPLLWESSRVAAMSIFTHNLLYSHPHKIHRVIIANGKKHFLSSKSISSISFTPWNITLFFVLIGFADLPHLVLVLEIVEKKNARSIFSQSHWLIAKNIEDVKNAEIKKKKCWKCAS